MNRQLTPVKAIRRKCTQCLESIGEIRDCSSFENDGAIEKCFLFPYRMGKRPTVRAEYTPIRSIRKHCLYCCNGSFNLVKECTVADCALFTYRFGKRPKGVGSSVKMPLQFEKTAA